MTGPLAAGEPVIVDLSIVTGIAALAFAGLFILVAAGFRAGVTRRARLSTEVDDLWMPVLVLAVREVPAEVPRLRRHHHVAVLTLWNRFTETLTGGAHDHLVELARRSGLGQAALRLVKRGPGPSRLLAAITLGRLGDRRAIPALRELLGENALVVRAEAARALVRINPVAGTRFVAPMVADWDDCHPATAVAILDDAPPDRVAAALGRELERSPSVDRQLRLVEMLGAVRGWSGLDAVRALLRRSDEPEVVARCLQVIRRHRQPADAPLVREFLHHEAPFVRVQAVAALGRIHAPGDEWRVLAALDDPEWWVRYRAAHALTTFTRVSRPYLELVSRVHPDRYARGALGQVLSESAVAA